MRNRASTALKKGKIRQSWSKYNLYNLSRLRNPPTQSRTFFQQKWTGKALCRAYHGEQVREGQWKLMFSKNLKSVVSMNPAELAQDDGSMISAGRGSGLDNQEHKSRPFPFTSMTFGPLERRLDVAIFRALFASSARQARQFVVHGAVTVNGQTMRYPGYLLNPGDLFQVDPQRVMYATGAPKNKYERREGRQTKKKAEEKEEGEENAAEDESKETKPEAAKEEQEDTRETLKALMAQAKNILSSEVLPVKRKQELRGFQKAVRRVLSRSGTSSVLTDSLEEQFSELTLLLKAKRAEKADSKSAKKKRKSETKSPSTQDEGLAAVEAAESEEAAPVDEKLSEAFLKAAQGDEVDTSELSDEEFEVLKRALTQMRDNPVDSSKPYATPWRPRDYMSAFAFIPRYLEVNQNICAAVYLRHPVARAGVGEVPSPFGEQISIPAYHWYVRRRW